MALPVTYIPISRYLKVSIEEIKHHAFYGNLRTKICVLPKIDETRLIRAHFLRVSSRYQVTLFKRERRVRII